MQNTKGKIIVIDGGDGSGKATQTKLLVERLSSEGRSVKTIDFPRYGTNLLGSLIRECLDGRRGDFIGLDARIASVLYAVDRFETLPTIRKWLEDGDIVIFDRYVSANQIHQGGKLSDPKAREEFLTWLDRLEFGVLGLPKPDVIVYLHVPVEISVGLARARAEAKSQEPDEAEKNTRHQLESQESALSIVKRSNNWVKVECAPEGAMLSPEVIHGKIYQAVKSFV
ncbi:MAG TPA: thymidylate kinase [Candidatus Paceibacterota bacterium]|nr:thymidylate kinase [Candidatus Paceibacterota bacterium]